MLNVAYSNRPKGDRPKQPESAPPAVDFLKFPAASGARVHCLAFNFGHLAVDQTLKATFLDALHCPA